ncbi:unnamed protein product [Microthlaspi erraticum]|uniref:Uncharacterized protein n=1 Tax=Microthlaspi erraticum TaxID=1685480 RepID=A0A6D2KED5_9BRAS|nr:unnamed protein product [Microthlaspi erraticum]CAA7051446.1 unnamed protein product [Microthlaspi erraticum]
MILEYNKEYIPQSQSDVECRDENRRAANQRGRKNMSRQDQDDDAEKNAPEPLPRPDDLPPPPKRYTSTFWPNVPTKQNRVSSKYDPEKTGLVKARARETNTGLIKARARENRSRQSASPSETKTKVNGLIIHEE